MSLVALACLFALVFALAIGWLVLRAAGPGLVSALTSPEMRHALWLTVWTSLLSGMLVMSFAIPVGYGLSRVRFHGSRLVRTVLYLPIALPQIVLGLCLLLLFSSWPATALLRPLGIELLFTWQGVVVAQFFTAFPYAVRVLKSTFDSIDPRLEFVSRSLGHSPIGTAWRVSLPLARGGILAAGAIAFARCAGAFGSVLVLAGGMRMRTETLPIALYLNLSCGDMDAAIAAGLLLVLMSSVGIYAIERMEAKP